MRLPPSIEERASLAQNLSAQMNRDHLAHDYSDLQITTSRHHNSRITHVVGSINSLKHFNNQINQAKMLAPPVLNLPIAPIFDAPNPVARRLSFHDDKNEGS